MLHLLGTPPRRCQGLEDVGVAMSYSKHFLQFGFCTDLRASRLASGRNIELYIELGLFIQVFDDFEVLLACCMSGTDQHRMSITVQPSF